MRYLLLLVALATLAGCMKPSDLYDGAQSQLRDVGLLDYSKTQRMASRRIQSDSVVFIAQGPFAPPGHGYARPNVVAEVAFDRFVEYFPYVRRARSAIGLDEARAEAIAAGAHYLLYTRFAHIDDAINTLEEWEEQEDFDRVGLDRAVIQMMLIELNTGFLVDTTTIYGRGGLLTFYDEKPENLIGLPLEQYARSLLGVAR